MTAELAVRKSVTLASPIALAFEVFTAHIESWWPMASHHIGEADCAAVVSSRGLAAAGTSAASTASSASGAGCSHGSRSVAWSSSGS